MSHQKQLKITKLCRKGASKLPEGCEEIHQRIQVAEEKLRVLQNELFQIQRLSYKHKISPPKRKRKDVFVRPQKIVLNNSVETLKRSLELSSMITGLEVQSFVKDDHCCIVYHMRHSSENQVKHGLRIEMKSGGHEVTKSSLPLGFDFNSVIDDYDNIMKPEYLLAIQKALLAYYERFEQYEALKRLLTVKGTMFKTLDGSHMEITFSLHNDEEQDENCRVILVLDYRVHDIRPKKYLVKAELPEEVLQSFQEQCAVLKKKPLHKAFKSVFIDGTGHWKLVQQLGARKEHTQQRVRTKRIRTQRNPNNDDTFHPEECSDQGEDEEYAE